MSKVKLNQQVNNNGYITTCAELLDADKAIVRKVDNFHSKRSESGVVTKYFCDVIENGEVTTSGWEIGQKAYESRLAQTEETLARLTAKKEEKPKELDERDILRQRVNTWIKNAPDNDFIEAVENAIVQYSITGIAPITPPIMGAFVELGVLEDKYIIDDVLHFIEDY